MRPAARITDISPGIPALAAVRPEFVEISVERPDGDANIAEGRIIGVSHLGETMQFLIQFGREMSIIARRPTPDAPRVAINDTVWCTWRPESVQVFPTDESAIHGGFVQPPTTGTVRTR
ncbi:TOBE domain-containing protein [Microbacterium elymi]|uniref:TOBE domain-containing protein n=1 Tax=Microbacterium elymi TaxID=2909587 RepID=A0ABY5NN37_9MICO|nr:TOBE domain-containing protein [Microbacterium elymi]UUT36548.1 TOBE domain-containing protein [Microbacterium elymi]